MTWEDELQQLDAELAAGRISAEEYRQRRDTVLGRAHAEQAEQSGSPSGGFPAQQPAWPQQPGGADPQSGGFGQQQQQNPFPPAFSWQQYGDQGHSGPQGVQQPPQQGSGDSTRVVNVNQPPAAPQQPGFPQQGQPPGVPPGGWPNSGQFPQQPGGEQAAWGQQWPAADAPGTPWGNSDLPPEHGDSSWMRQGPEVFETAGKSGRGKVAGLTVGGVLLVGVIVAGVFFFLSGGGDESQPQAAGPETSTSEQPPTSTEPPLPEPPAAKPAPQNADNVLIAAPGGPEHPFNGALKPAALEGAKSGVLPPPVRKFALDNGTSDGWFRGTDPKQNPIGTSMIAVRMPDEATAEELTAKYRDQQQTLTVLDDLSYQGVPVYSSGEILRAAYTTHDWMVVVEVRAIDKPAGQARSLFEDLLSKQLAKTPPTVRE
ncbi:MULTISPECIES: hypothetical protein [unclassified Actinopolyspora]|uniref:hypothetical protein n=1 Tax=unclassified Actinopolyspora TaxID=2639451 RepID=UPI0013F605C8|nr:hypothetical protein [Actinopolyspora sp. BKK2]NHE77294.1 hypothetical protein [Actinopolyspora sp. BKK1]